MDSYKTTRAKTGAGTAGSYAPHTHTPTEIPALTSETTTKPTKQPKFAPAREDGLKPYVRSAYSFGKTTDSLVWANTAADAKHAGYHGAYTSYTARRATPADVESLGE
jgi:hypothetical protein